MARKLFCELCPAAYRLSVEKEILRRKLQDLARGPFAKRQMAEPLPVLVYRHKSLIRRRLGQVDMQLQENKAVNLALAAPRVHGVVIAPGETFSFWRMVGRCTARKGYRPGMTIRNGATGQGVGGGMCQFTNLIHWMALHSPLTVVEHHHHDQMDLFPDLAARSPLVWGLPSPITTWITGCAMTQTNCSSCVSGWMGSTCAASCGLSGCWNTLTTSGRKTSILSAAVNSSTGATPSCAAQWSGIPAGIKTRC